MVHTTFLAVPITAKADTASDQTSTFRIGSYRSLTGVLKTTVQDIQTSMIIKAVGGGVSGLMTQQVKALVPKSEDLSSIPGINTVEGGN